MPEIHFGRSAAVSAAALPGASASLESFTITLRQAAVTGGTPALRASLDVTPYRVFSNAIRQNQSLHAANLTSVF